MMLDRPDLYYEMGHALHCVDLSLAIKSGVQFTLWGGSVMNLGTEKHHDRYRDQIASFTLPGCFAMTELEHGSNVADIVRVEDEGGPPRTDPRTCIVNNSPPSFATRLRAANSERDRADRWHRLAIMRSTHTTDGGVIDSGHGYRYTSQNMRCTVQ